MQNTHRNVFQLSQVPENAAVILQHLFITFVHFYQFWLAFRQILNPPILLPYFWGTPPYCFDYISSPRPITFRWATAWSLGKNGHCRSPIVMWYKFRPKYTYDNRGTSTPLTCPIWGMCVPSFTYLCYCPLLSIADLCCLLPPAASPGSRWCWLNCSDCVGLFLNCSLISVFKVGHQELYVEWITIYIQEVNKQRL